MTGHVFVVRGDLTELACDDVLVPTDAERMVTDGFLAAVPERVRGERREQHTAVRCEGGDGPGRVVRLPECGDGPQAWLVDVSGDPEHPDPGWFAAGVREFLDWVAADDRPPARGRARPLVALPLVGTGEGGAARRRDQVILELLPTLRASAEEHGHDIALVLGDVRDAGAVQYLRHREGMLDDVLTGHQGLARRLADQARSGQLALFLGAGVSAGAGLPSWGALLRQLGEEAGMSGRELDGLGRLAPQDAASLLQDRLGAERLGALVRGVFGPRRHSLAHSLLANLPVLESVTTNYDPLFERAVEAAGHPLRVLPWEDAEPGVPWLLKLHGDAERPGEVVLTRDDYLRSGADRTALDAVVQSVLLTRHMLFVGFSLVDEHFVRVAHPVSALLREARGGDEPYLVGTALSLVDDPLRAALWSRDLETVGMVGEHEHVQDCADGCTVYAEAARTLEVFLDLLCAHTAAGQPFLLDERYDALLEPDDRALADALRALEGLVRPDRSGAHAEVREVLARLGARV
ncbi:MAG: SIR2 family protein [Actinomycetota bacterium]|nr:SIR2 family protein [Actinomycetota bacterium]